MSDHKDGGPAFGQVVELRCVRVDPTGATEWEPEAMLHGGLTVRDYFAAKALTGMLTEPAAEGDMYTSVALTQSLKRKLKPGERLAIAAYILADAMLAARNA